MTVTKKIDLETYRQNLENTIARMSPARVMAIVKADGYGHGLVETSLAAEQVGIEILGVLDIESGLKLRKAGVKVPLFAWLHSPQSNIAAAVKAGIELSASSITELESVASASGRASIHLKLDTGLSRNGCRIEKWEPLVAKAFELERAGNVKVVAIWSHLSGTSKADDDAALELFEQGTQVARSRGFQGYRHIASSPSAFANIESRLDLVRIGVSAFGTSPLENRPASEFALRAPMTLTAEVHSDGVISIGFLHGLFSSLAEKFSVIINGKSYLVKKIGPLASQIEQGDYEIGDEVTVFGPEGQLAQTAEDLALAASTVTDELFTGLKANLVTYSS